VESWIDPIRSLVAIAITFFLVMLRFEAEKFGAAEYDEPTRDGRRGSFLRRLSWILLGLALVGALIVIHPNPADDLSLLLGDRGEALLLGFGFGALGTVQAVAYAYYRYGHIRFPPAWTYPGAVLNALGTAFIDEATFRGAVLGLLLLTGLDPAVAVVIQGLLYVLATRTGAPGREQWEEARRLPGFARAGRAGALRHLRRQAFVDHGSFAKPSLKPARVSGRPMPSSGVS